MRLQVPAAVLALVLLAGCGAPEAEDARTDDAGSLVTGRVLTADDTPAAGATLLVYRATEVSEATGEADQDTRWLKTRHACDEEGRFRIRVGGFPLVQLIAKREEFPDEASQPVFAKAGEDVVLRLP